MSSALSIAEREFAASVRSFVFAARCVCVRVLFFTLVGCFIPWLIGLGELFVAFNRLNLNNLICHIIFIHAVNKL